MTAMLVRGGTALIGDTTLGVRLLFLVCGALLPFAVYALARPVVGARDAWLAAGATLTLPLLAVMGAVAVPDSPLVLLAVCVALFLERAARTGRLRYWVLAGVCAALGLCTHYRFALIVLGAGLFLLATRQGRASWRTPGPWLAAAVTVTGLAPVLLFNLQLDWAPMAFQAGARHAQTGGFGAWLRHPLEQAGVTTPFAYVALLCALVAGVHAARRGDRGRALLCCFALAPLGTYFLLSPFTDTDHDYVHWPVVGYLPLLPLLPGVLRGWAPRGRLGRAAGVAAAALGPALVLVAFVDVATGWLDMPFLHGPFGGWSELAPATREHLAAGRNAAPPPGMDAPGPSAAPPGPPAPALVFADNYRAASELQFRLGDEAQVFVADHPLNTRHGRGLQFELWERDEAAFLRRSSARALVVEEVSESRRRERSAWEARLRGFFEEWEPLGQLVCHPGERVFRFFAGRGIRDAGDG
jgi:hypothetical protein